MSENHRQVHKYDFCEKHGHDVNDNTGYSCWECGYETISTMGGERKELRTELADERRYKENVIKSIESLKPYIARLEAVAEAADKELLWVGDIGHNALGDALTALEEWRKEEA